MKFDLAKAQAGHPVEIFKNLTLDDAFASIGEHSWTDLNVHFIGEDIGGNIIYQINDESDNCTYVSIRSINPKFLRMKPKYKTWWFRTWVFENGQPYVVCRESKEEIDNWIFRPGYWLDESWTKEISINEHF